MKVKLSVSGILRCEDEIFLIKRSCNLRAFPGYSAFPGGKVDSKDYSLDDNKSESRALFNALRREIIEEIDFDINSENVNSIKLIGEAISPDFNPYMFKTYFYIINIKKKVKFNIERHEIEQSLWIAARDALDSFDRGELLMVPPTKILLENFSKGNYTQTINLSYEVDELDVPSLEVVKDFFQLMPLSQTFPPANRTNAFIVGDLEHKRGSRLLIDPSPKDTTELKKLLNTASNLKFNKILITHHHPDHHQFAPDIARQFNVPIMLSLQTKKNLLTRWGDNYLDNIELVLLKDGDIVCNYLKSDVSIYNVPGHDNGQVALMPTTKEWCIVGDLVQTYGTVVIGGPESSMIDYFKSLQKIIDLNPMTIFPSHGISLGGCQLLKKTLKHRKYREVEISKLLDKNKNSTEILEIIYPSLNPNLIPYALATIESHIKKIEMERV